MLNQQIHTMNDIEEANTLHKGIEEWIKQGRQKVDDAIRIGEILTNHRARFGKQAKWGEPGWLDYFKRNFTFSQQTGSEYMTYFKYRERLRDARSVSEAHALTEGLGQRPIKQKSVQSPIEKQESNGESNVVKEPQPKEETRPTHPVYLASFAIKVAEKLEKEFTDEKLVDDLNWIIDHKDKLDFRIQKILVRKLSEFIGRIERIRDGLTIDIETEKINESNQLRLS